MVKEELRQKLVESCILHPAGGKGLRNVILIGMPGCGKSTVAHVIASEYGFADVDADTEFERMYGITPAECINGSGEAEFRRMESGVLAGMKKDARMCIATGGGVVTVPDNLKLLKELGFIVYIRRDLSELSVKGRPLSAGKGVETLYEERAALYEGWSDAQVDNINVRDTAHRIMELYRAENN